MNNILVAIGYGRFAPQYYAYTQQLAHYFGATLTLIHVYNTADPIKPMEEDKSGKDLLDDEWDQKYHVELDRLNTFALEYGLLEFGHIKVNCEVQAGTVDLALTDFTNNRDFDLLLMGMRKHKFTDRLLGNIVSKVIDNVSIPTLLVPPLSNIRLVRNITYATTLNVGSLPTIEYLLDWCLAFNCKITLAHVTAVGNSENAKNNLKSIRDVFHKEKAAGILTTKLLFGNIQTAIQDYVGRSNSDILVIHKRKRGFWNSIMTENLSLELTEKLNIPMLVLSNPAERSVAAQN